MGGHELGDPTLRGLLVGYWLGLPGAAPGRARANTPEQNQEATLNVAMKLLAERGQGANM